MKKVNLLIVEDDTLLRQSLRNMLEEEPFINAVYEPGTR
jgi:DNA-binding response OmpR family regulator